MVRLELRHYRAVLALRHHRTVTAAAAALGLSQSAISHQLAEAERRLGRKLTVRSGRKLWLNTAGELLASSAEIILNEASHVETHLISGSERTETRILRIATFAYNSYRWLPEFLKIEKTKRPNVNFEFVASAPGLPVRAMENGEADLGVIAGQIKSRHVVAVPLFDDELVCVCPKNHPLAARPFLEADDFVDYPFITYSAHFESGFEGGSALAAFRQAPETHVECGLHGGRDRAGQGRVRPVDPEPLGGRPIPCPGRHRADQGDAERVTAELACRLSQGSSGSLHSRRIEPFLA